MKGIIYDEHKKRYITSTRDCPSVVQEALAINISNKSLFGCTISKAKNMIFSWLDKELNLPQVVVLEFGGNDCDYDWREVSKAPEQDHLPFTPTNYFVDDYESVIFALKNKQIIPVLMSLPPISAKRYFSWITRDKDVSPEKLLVFLKDVQKIYRHQEFYSNMIAPIAEKCKCYYFDLRTKMLCLPDYEDYLCIDGIHPNEKGYSFISTEWIKYAHQIGL